jgi:hypothetical protein
MVTSLLTADGIPAGHETGKSCPKTKEDISAIIKQTGIDTFGPSANPGVINGAPLEPSACAKKSLADATKLNLDIGTAWRAVRQHPQFEVRSV